MDGFDEAFYGPQVLWEEALTLRLEPYLPIVRAWWNDYASLDVRDTGVYPILDSGVNGAPNMFFRFTRSAHKSPIKNIQAFPFIPSSYLQLNGVPGGAVKMVSILCMNNRFLLEEFTLVAKHNIPSMANCAQFIAFIPTEYIVAGLQEGAYIYLSVQELNALITLRNIVPASIVNKCLLRV